MRIIVLGVLTALVLSGPEATAQRKQASTIEKVRPALNASPRLLPATEPLVRLLAFDCDTDRSRGREAAGFSHSGTGWLAGGFVSGAFLGLIGTAITWALANSSTATPDRMPDSVEQSCFREGYSAKARSTNSGAALTGGLLGTALLVVLVVSASSSTSY